MTSFLKRWRPLLPPNEPVNPEVPAIDMVLAGPSGKAVRRTFLVDSGADISLAPRRLCEQLGFEWDTGVAMELRGISPRPECAVDARRFDVDLLLPDIEVALTVPMCFADGDVSLLLGREGFFDCFRIELDKSRLVTRFELLET